MIRESNTFRRQGYLDRVNEETQTRKTYKRTPEQRKQLSDSLKATWAKKREQEKTAQMAV